MRLSRQSALKPVNKLVGSLRVAARSASRTGLSCPETDKLREITVVLIAACTTLIEDLTLLISDPLPPNSARRAFLMPVVRLCFRWLMNRSRVIFVKSIVDSFKTTIILLVSTMDLATKIHRNVPYSTRQPLITQVASSIMFAEDATETLCRYKDCQDIQSENNSYVNLTAGSNTPKQIGSPTPEPEQASVLLHSRPVSDRYDETSTTEAHNQISTSALNFDDTEYYVQLSHGCNRMIEIQQMSCALAQTVLESTAAKPGRTSQPTSHVPLSESESPFTARESAQPRSSSQKDSTTLQSKRHEPAIDAIDQVQHLDDLLRHKDRSGHQTPLRHGNDAYPATSGDAPRVVESVHNNLSASMPLPLKPQTIYNEVQAAYDDGEDLVPREHAQSIPRELPTPPLENTKPISPSPPFVAKEESMLTKLEKLLLRREEELEDEKEKERNRVENAKFDRLEKILISQQEAKIEKEAARKAAKEAEEQAVAEARKQGNMDKLEKPEKLILAQKDEQLKREKALEAVRRAEMAEVDARQAERAAVPILFEDAIGRKFSCPWQTCKT
ncbi:Trichoplein multi-domain protein [Pyrenophora tritici-repentis]|uniref:Trichoplein multi-domain protein n=2 Tax=Pyrenophora tritici-repentis TaxID=45151 RepID=A0A834VKM8_9PLEO|nr:Trichoplein multi-domain protein [Pyrenophora tritici-repentis]KAI1507908.1 hypothetical protein Ptr86124_013162 [Pyrenophora tritici-repentis]KAI1684339.1 hypothetical protein KJE20_06844 [Pyrenophora tritici-repentis]